jgi:short-subunit dehydrogenase
MPRLMARKAGHIAIVSSVTGYGGLPTSSAYGATKAALINIAECLKIELDRHDIRVSVICPGFVETPAQDDNDFPKPFMVSADTAARRILRGLKSRRFEITFPWRFTQTLKFLKWLPRRAYCNLIKKQTGWHKLPEEGGSAGPDHRA